MSKLAVIAAILAVSGSVADANRRGSKPRHAPGKHVDAEKPVAPRKKLRRAKRGHAVVAVQERAPDDLQVDAIQPPAARGQRWHFALGPYLWAPSVSTDVSLGGTKVSTEVDPADVAPNAEMGIEANAEARYRRFSLTGDMMYAVIGLNGNMDLGPVAVAYNGEASTLFLDTLAGVTLLGDRDHSLFSAEARLGIRYQRTAVKAAVDVAGGSIEPPQLVFDGSDALVGGRVFSRPHDRVELSASVDVGVTGASKKTWSAEADASFQVTKHVQLSLGYRSLTLERSIVNITMHGPRAAVTFLF